MTHALGICVKNVAETMLNADKRSNKTVVPLFGISTHKINTYDTIS